MITTETPIDVDVTTADLDPLDRTRIAYELATRAEGEKTAYDEAMVKLQGEMVPLNEGGKGGQWTYARLEDLDKVVRPRAKENGFFFSFDSRRWEHESEDLYTITLWVCHEAGHRESFQLPIRADHKNRTNALQAVGSMLTYARRYLLCNALNLVVGGEDDDGEAAGAYTEPREGTYFKGGIEQKRAEELLRQHAKQKGCTYEFSKGAFLKLLGIKDWTEIPSRSAYPSSFTDAIECIEASLDLPTSPEAKRFYVAATGRETAKTSG